MHLLLVVMPNALHRLFAPHSQQEAYGEEHIEPWHVRRKEIEAGWDILICLPLTNRKQSSRIGNAESKSKAIY